MVTMMVIMIYADLWFPRSHTLVTSLSPPAPESRVCVWFVSKKGTGKCKSVGPKEEKLKKEAEAN